MKSRLIWAAVLLAAIAAFYVVTIRPTHVQSPGFSRKRPPLRDLKPPEVALPSVPMPTVEMPTLTLLPLNAPLPNASVAATRASLRASMPEVPIQDNATIDFSLGAPHVRVQGKDQDALERALKEMAEATKDTTFPPTKK